MASSSRPHLVPIDTIVRMLAERTDALARELLPLGHRDGAEWREASTRRGGSGDSLSVHIGGGARRGVWARHGGGPDEAGDALDLVAYVLFAGDKRQAIPWAKRWLGLEAGAAVVTTAPPRPERPEDDADAQRRHNAAQHIYLSGTAIDGTAVEAYLRGRGLDVRRLGFPLRALRFHPGLWDRHSQRRWPAMVAAVTASDGKFLAAHQTFLEVLSSGRVRKAPIVDAQGNAQAKRVLGSYRGGAIRLWRGTVIDPDTGEVRQARPLAKCREPVWVDITEGIEDGLTVALADNEARVLCAVSVSNLAALRLPACVGGVVLWRQNDAPGSRADQAVERAIAEFTKQGRQVAQARPPAGIKDANDLACAGSRRETATV